MNSIEIYEEIVYLISCALNDIIPENIKLTHLDLLYLFSKRHSLTAMIAYTLESTKIFSSIDSQMSKQWKEAKDKAIRKNILLDNERKLILDEMEEAKIWHVPLKGIILKDLYPKYGMREMADNDILYDKYRQKDVMNIFLKHHYKAESIGVGVHDVYMKEPIYNFEMHTDLFASDLNDYYHDIKERLCLKQGKQFSYDFTDDDFYIYMIAHAHKHYSHSGTGLRTLVDIYVYNQKKQLDRNYIKQELKKLGIEEFEEKTRKLVYQLFNRTSKFSIDELTEDDQQLFLYYCDSGTYGNLKKRIENSLQETHGHKLKYLLTRLFPNRKWCKNNGIAID